MKKVLIVDDEPSIIMSLEYLIKKSGYHVFVARDGAEALSIVESENPNLIILDIMMPEVDGYEVCEYVKNEKKNCKIIFLSAKGKEVDIERGYDAGADYYMTKPFSTKKLVSKVNEMMDLTI